MRVLVTGGAGYIGGHCARMLEQSGIQTVVFDNLEHGHRDVVPGDFFEGDLRDCAALDSVFSRYSFDAVMHFAALVVVEESVSQPARYIHTNTLGTLNLLEAMKTAGCSRLVFSSTAAVYGNPVQAPISEEHPLRPLNPYGLAKTMAESEVEYHGREHRLRWVVFRYFNAAGRDFPFPDTRFRDADTHLITRVLNVAQGSAPQVDIFGTDYATPDGTCVRDYVHVRDICRAHILALEYLRAGKPCGVFNIGSGRGYSVLEVTEACRRVTGKNIPQRLAGRREGDPASLVATNDRLRKEMGWKPEFDSLEPIIESAWRFHGASTSERAGSTCR